MAVNHDCQALRSADRYVETIAVEQEVCTPRRFIAPRGCHRENGDRGLLPLKFVDGADLRSGRKPLLKQIDLHVVGSYDEDVGER